MTDEVLEGAYRSLVDALRAAVRDGQRVTQPHLLAVQTQPDGQCALCVYDLLDARQHLYAMRAIWLRDAVEGFVFGVLGEARFTDQTVPAVLTVLATPTRVVAEMREVSPDGLHPPLQAPPAAVAAYRDVFDRTVPLPLIRAPQRR